MRRWFIQQEIDLFRFRFLNERINSSNGAEVIEKFLSENNLNFTYISDSERSKLTNQLIAGTAAPGINVDTTAFYKVYILVIGINNYILSKFLLVNYLFSKVLFIMA